MRHILLKKFNIKDCKAYSKKTGDINILHLSKNLKKISQFEKPIVQGALVVETLLIKKFVQREIENASSIFIIFKKPIFINENINFYIIKNKYELKIVGSNLFEEKIIIRVELSSKEKKIFCKQNIFSQKNNFKNLISRLRLISKKVGNYEKKLNLISTISISIGSKNKNKVFVLSNNLFKLDLTNNNFSINTFFLSYDKIFSETLKFKSNIKIKDDKFKNSKILILGGSSGLGRVLSSFMLSQNLNIDFTYNNSLKSSKEIQYNFGKKRVKFFQFNEKKLDILKKIKDYDFIYFFPTPKIFNLSEKYFNYKYFSKFNMVYINLLLKVVETLASSTKKHILYVPSTKLLHNFENNIEYNSSKLIQETIIKKFNKIYKNLTIYNPRLESFSTRTTKGLINNQSNYDNFLKSAINL